MSVVERVARDAPRPAVAGEVDAPARVRDAPVLAVLLTLVCLVPIALVVVRMAGRPYFPLQDLAVVETRVRDVWSLNTPLIGPYSKNFNHPGPMFFWLLAIPSLLTGQAAWSTLVTSALAMGFAIVASARVAWRTGGIALVIVALAATTLSLRDTFLYMDPWNPNTAQPFFILLLLLIAATAAGDLSKLIWVAIVASFLLQTHVGYLTVVVAPVALLAVVLVRRSRHDPSRTQGLGRRTLLALAVTVVLWLPPLVQQFFSSGGNVSAMLGYSERTQDRAVGLLDGMGLLATDFRWRPTWLGGLIHVRFPGDEVPSSVWWLLVPVALVAVAAYLLRRTRPRDPHERAVAWFLAVAATCCVAAIPGLAQVRPPVDVYLYRWRAPLAAALVLAALLVIGRRLPGRRVVLGVGAVVVAALMVTNTMHMSQQIADGVGPRPGHILPFEPIAVKLAHATLAKGLPREPFLMRSAGDPHEGVYEGLTNEFIRRGAPVRVDPWFEYKWGHRAAKKRDVQRVVYVTTLGSLADRLAAVPTARVLSRVTPLSASEERSIVRLQAEVVTSLRAIEKNTERRRLRDSIDSTFLPFLLGDAGIKIPKRDLDRLTALNEKVQRRGCRCAVVEMPVGDAPF